jgi:hypothetical protein
MVTKTRRVFQKDKVKNLGLKLKNNNK